MSKATIGAVLLALALLMPVPANADVGVGIRIDLPLPIAFVAPPEVIVIPGTYVYVVPDIGSERGEGPRGRDDGPGRPARGGEGDRGVR